jgi:RNA polymerase sigma factor for flagellar operon FliA
MNLATAQYQLAVDTADREKLILDHVEYVRCIFSTMAVKVTNEDDRENLYSAGVVGLVQAANSFDPARGVSFKTYAYPRIRGAIVDELRRVSPVPQEVLKQIGMIKKAYQQLEPPVSPELLAQTTGLTLDQVLNCLEAMRFTKPQDWNDLNCMIHASWQNEEGSPDRDLEKQEMKRILADGIESLPDKERITVTLYFVEELTLKEIGSVINLSEARVSRLLAAAKFRLKEFVRRHTS